MNIITAIILLLTGTYLITNELASKYEIVEKGKHRFCKYKSIGFQHTYLREECGHLLISGKPFKDDTGSATK